MAIKKKRSTTKQSTRTNRATAHIRDKQLKGSKLLNPRRKPSQDRAQVTVAAILEAAAEILVDVGYARASTNMVAARAGVSIGSLYQYFPNKDALFIALIEDHVRDIHPKMEALIGILDNYSLPLETVMRKSIEGIIDMHTGEPSLHRILMEEVPQPARLLKRQRENELHFAVLVEAKLRAHPEVQVRDYRIAAHLIVQTIRALSQWLVHKGPHDFDRSRFISESVKMVTGYLTGR